MEREVEVEVGVVVGEKEEKEGVVQVTVVVGEKGGVEEVKVEKEGVEGMHSLQP